MILIQNIRANQITLQMGKEGAGSVESETQTPVFEKSAT